VKRIAIVGGGTAGTIVANRLRRRLARPIRRREATITVIEPASRHLYQPGLLFLPFERTPRRLDRRTSSQLHRDVHLRRGAVRQVDTVRSRVHLDDGGELSYDVLVIATGARLLPTETEGLTGPGWRRTIFDFYSLDGAQALQRALATMTEGRLVINVVEMPIKCPVAPLEFAFLADAYFTQRGIRDRVSITYVTPLDGAFTKPVASGALGDLLRTKRIELVTEFAAGRVDGAKGVLYSWDEREVPFDLLVTVPLHGGAEFVSRSPGLGDDLGFVLTDPQTLQAKVAPAVFAIGDATNVQASKAGSVAHFEAEVLTENVVRYLDGKPLRRAFDGHANCFVETGNGRALLIDFNYDVEPLPGVFPLPRIGPLRLLRESRLNHLAKLAFKWIYWNVLLPGRDIPGIGARLSMRGKTQVTPSLKPIPQAVATAATGSRV
jgi:sulfide:quinone oxidoreductase